MLTKYRVPDVVGVRLNVSSNPTRTCRCSPSLDRENPVGSVTRPVKKRRMSVSVVGNPMLNAVAAWITAPLGPWAVEAVTMPVVPSMTPVNTPLAAMTAPGPRTEG